jgi:hypothetical protein
MEIIIILIVILVVFYFCYLNSKNNKLTKTEAFNAGTHYDWSIPPPSPIDQRQPSEPHITMYEHIDNRGAKFYCRIGFTSFEDLNNQHWNDATSSISIPQGLRAVFYEHADRGGRKLSLDAGDYPNLVNFGWNDMISSIDVFTVYKKIEEEGAKIEAFNASSPNVPTIPPSYNLPTIPPLEPHITMYEHHNFWGRRFYCRIGFTNYSLLNKLSFNDKASSIIIPQGLRAVFYEHADRGGRQLSLDAGDYPNLDIYGWNDMISSVDVFTVYKKIEEEGANM